MELQNITHVIIRSYDPALPKIKISVVIYNGVLYEDLLKKTGVELGLKKESLKYFTICQGHEWPIKRFKTGDVIALGLQDLSFQKWCFDLKEERDLILRDPAATHLIFSQAQHDISTGKLKPSKDESERLIDCLDPDFPADGQYLKLCHNLPDYNKILIPKGQIFGNDPLRPSPFLSSSYVDVILSIYGLHFSSGNQCLKFTWCDPIKWTINKEQKTLTYFFKGNDSSMSCIPLFTEQIDYLCSVMFEMLQHFQKLDKDCDCDLSFHVDMIERLEDGSSNWTNGLYDPVKSSQFRDKL